MFRIRAVIGLIALTVSACGAASAEIRTVPSTPAPAPQVATFRVIPPEINPWDVNPDTLRYLIAAQKQKLWDDTVAWDNTVAWNVAANAPKPHVSLSSSHNYSSIPVYSSGNVGDTAQCIKNHESGNYAESSHTQDGSGAYQFIPRTWQHYFALWKAATGYGFKTLPDKTVVPDPTQPDYSLAYQAPPWVQDGVLQYALANGGAGNWSNRFGNDPCTGN